MDGMPDWEKKMLNMEKILARKRKRETQAKSGESEESGSESGSGSALVSSSNVFHEDGDKAKESNDESGVEQYESRNLVNVGQSSNIDPETEEQIANVLSDNDSDSGNEEIPTKTRTTVVKFDNTLKVIDTLNPEIASVEDVKVIKPQTSSAPIKPVKKVSSVTAKKSKAYEMYKPYPNDENYSNTWSYISLGSAIILVGLAVVIRYRYP